MNAQEIISSGILELYCTGLASDAEAAEVLAWAKQYPEVAAEIEAIQSGLESYAHAHAVEPAPSVKEKLFAAINTNETAPVANLNTEEKATAMVYSISPAWKYAAAASIILLTGSLLMNYTFYNKYQTADKELASVKTELQEQKAMAADMDSTIRLIGSMNARTVAVTGTDTATGDMGAKIYWMKNSNEVYIDPANLPKAPEGKQYEFWAIVDGVPAPVNGGVITAEINGKKIHVQKMKSFGNVKAFAISLEDIGPAKTKPDKVMAVGSI